MLPLLSPLIAAVGALFRTCCAAALEILALRHQIAVLKRGRPGPTLCRADRIFWVALQRIWPGWATALQIVQPATVVRWHRAGFRLFWRWRSRPRGGRPAIAAHARELISTLAATNPTWGAPRIHAELRKLGFRLAERTVARYLRRLRRRGDPHHRWLAFLRNHREVLAAFDFFTVPTVSFQILYCFFVIDHARRRILHCNVTRHPTASWVVQQLREAFPTAAPYRYVLYDHDAIFSPAVTAFLKSTGLQPKRTSVHSPWQNGLAERWVGTCRRELLDRVIPLNERHLRRLLREYIAYYHQDRPHDALDKDAPEHRPVESQPAPNAKVVALPRLGGLHHRYNWQRAA